MAPSRKMSLPFDQRIRPERKLALKVALMNHATKCAKKAKGNQRNGDLQFKPGIKPKRRR